MTEEPRRPSHYAAFAGMSLIWGSTFLAIRFGNDTVPPLWGATVRLLLAAPILFALALARGAPLARGGTLAGVAFFGFLNLGVNFALLYWGEQRVPTSFASWWPIRYLVLAGNLGAYVLYAWLLARWKATNVTMVALVIPVIAVILGS